MSAAIRICGWIGTAALVAVPLFLPQAWAMLLAVFGFAMLTVQTSSAKIHNLTVLNVVGIVTYFGSWYVNF